MKTCTRCKEQKLSVDFHKNKKKPDGLQDICKICIKEISKISRENNKKYRAGEYISAKATEIPMLTREKLANMELKVGTSYKVIMPVKRKLTTVFEGILISQTDRYIVLRHNKHGYLESFMKVDFFTGERELKEVV